MSLRVCSSCSRHVREPSCPFCGAEGPGTTPPAPRPRVARAVMLGAAAAMATACTSVTPLYGGSPPDASADGQADAAQDGMIAFYGGPPIDSGPLGDSGPGDSGPGDSGDGGG
jgi:hypothetical protein